MSDTYHVALGEEFAESSEVDQEVVEDLLRDGRVSFLFLEFGGQMEDLVHNDEEVVAAPLRVAGHELRHDGIDLFNDVHL